MSGRLSGYMPLKLKANECAATMRYLLPRQSCVSLRPVRWPVFLTLKIFMGWAVLILDEEEGRSVIAMLSTFMFTIDDLER